MSVCECHVLDWAYKYSRFTREPIDDGMVPLSRLMWRSLFNVMVMIIKYRESEYRLMIDWLRWLMVIDWRMSVCECHVGLSVQVLKIHERANRWYDAQLIVGDVSVQCDGDDHQVSRERETESEYRLTIDWLRWLIDWRMSVCECHVLDWAYKFLRFAREPIDDGMLLSRLMERSLLNVMVMIIKYRERERERVSIDWWVIDDGDWLENEYLWVSCVGLSVQVLEIHERANRWWNAAQLIVVEVPVECDGDDHQVSRESESEYRLIEMIDWLGWLMLLDWLENECLWVSCVGLSVQVL